MNNNNTSSERIEEKDKIDQFLDLITENRLAKYLRRKILLRKTIIFYSLLIPIILLMVGGLTSPKRTGFTQEQLAVERRFANSSGKMTLFNQIYSESNNIAILAFETTDNTSAVAKGINANNLEWNIFFKPEVDSSRVETYAIPLTDNKVYLIVKNIPKDFGVFITRANNQTVVTNNIDIELKKYNNLVINENEVVDEETKELTAFVDFYITPQSQEMVFETIEDMSRESFTLALFSQEREFQNKQKERITSSISVLQESIKEDEETIKQFQTETQYLVGKSLAQKYDDIEKIYSDITKKQEEIDRANENLMILDELIKNIDSNILALKEGTYKFSAPISAISMTID